MLRRDVIREIVERDRQKKGLAEETVLHDAKELHEAACGYFGTWNTALRYAGVDRRRLDALNAYSRDGVTKELHRLCVYGYNLSAARNMRRDRRLYYAAVQHFGDWTEALEAAGIDSAHVHTTAKPRRHDKQRIIEALQQRHHAGLSFSWGQVCRQNHALATAAKNAYGSWRRALVAAGIQPEPRRAPARRKWNKERVISQIQERHRQHKPLTYTATRRDNGGLICAAKQYFGRWNAALEAAGVVSGEGVDRKEGS